MNWTPSSSSSANQNPLPSAPLLSANPTSRSCSLDGQFGLLSWLLPCRPALPFCSGVFPDTGCSRPTIPALPFSSCYRHAPLVSSSVHFCSIPLSFPPHQYFYSRDPPFSLFTPICSATDCNLEFCVCRHDPLLVFTFIVYTNARSSLVSPSQY